MTWIAGPLPLPVHRWSAMPFVPAISLACNRRPPLGAVAADVRVGLVVWEVELVQGGVADYIFFLFFSIFSSS